MPKFTQVIAGFFTKDVSRMNLLINEKGHLCTLHHKSIVDGRIYRELIVAERTESHYRTLEKAVGTIIAQNTANLAAMFDKGDRIIWSNEKC